MDQNQKVQEDPYEGLLSDHPDLQGPLPVKMPLETYRWTVSQIIPAPIEMTVVFALGDYSDFYTETPACLALLRCEDNEITWEEVVPVLNGGEVGLTIEPDVSLLTSPMFVQIVMRGSEHVAAVFEGWRQKCIDEGLLVETEPGRYEHT